MLSQYGPFVQDSQVSSMDEITASMVFNMKLNLRGASKLPINIAKQLHDQLNILFRPKFLKISIVGDKTYEVEFEDSQNTTHKMSVSI